MPCPRVRRRKKSGLGTYSDEIFHKYVLSNRISMETYSHWRPLILERASRFGGGDFDSVVKSINEYVANLKKYSGNRFGGMHTPIEIARTDAVVRDAERALMAVAMLRVLGIPARYKRDWGWVEFLKGEEWLPLYPKEPDRLGSKKAKEGSAEEKAYATPATIEVQLMFDGKPVEKAFRKFYEHFSISRFTSSGAFSWANISTPVYNAEKKCHILKLLPGNYYLSAGKRNTINESYVRMIPFSCKEGETVKLQIKTDLPEDGSLPIVRNPGSFVNIEGTTLTGKQFNLSTSLKSGKKVIVVFFDPFSEPCVAMMPQLKQFLNRKGIEVIGIGAGGSADDFRTFVSKYCHGLAVIHDTNDELTKKYKAAEMPSILILAPDGGIIMWTEGHNLGIGELVKKAVK